MALKKKTSPKKPKETLRVATKRVSKPALKGKGKKTAKLARRTAKTTTAKTNTAKAAKKTAPQKKLAKKTQPTAARSKVAKSVKKVRSTPVTPTEAVLKEGQIAPNFSLKDKSGSPLELNAVESKFTVVYFYPKDDTPGCTLEAQEFSTAQDVLAGVGAKVIGISGGNEKSKTKFCEKYSISLPLLSDSDFSVAKAYGVFGEKTFMGRKYLGISRSTFILDASKQIIKIYPTVKPEKHAEEVIDFIASLPNA